MSLVSPSLWITPVKISISGLMYVTGVTVTGVTFLMDNTTEDQYIRSYVLLSTPQIPSVSMWLNQAASLLPLEKLTYDVHQRSNDFWHLIHFLGLSLKCLLTVLFPRRLKNSITQTLFRKLVPFD